MKGKQLLLLIVIGAILGAGAYLIYQKRQSDWQADTSTLGQKLFQEFPVNDVTSLDIQDPENQLDLVKEEGTWKVQQRYGYPANAQKIGDFLLQMWDMKGVQRVQASTPHLARLQLQKPSQGDTNSAGTLVTFESAEDNVLNSLLLGKTHMQQGGANQQSPFGGPSGSFPDGRYIQVNPHQESAQDNPEVWLISDPLSNISTDPASWLNKSFFKVQNLQSIRVEPSDGEAWTMTRSAKGESMKLEGLPQGMELNQSQTSNIGNALSSPSFNDVADPALEPEAMGLDNPLLATLTTFDGFEYTVRVGNKTEDEEYYLQVNVQAELPEERQAAEDETEEEKSAADAEFEEKQKELTAKLEEEQKYADWTYLVSRWSISPLLKKRSDLIKEPEPAEEEEEESDTTDSSDSEEEEDLPQLPGEFGTNPLDPQSSDP